MVSFHRHESAFERLVIMAHEDTHLHAITRDTVMVNKGKGDWAAASPQVIPRKRWDEYQRLFEELNLPTGIVIDGQNVDFRLDDYSVLNGDSCKGIEYSAEPLPTCTTELSTCRPTKKGLIGHTVNRVIKTNWYLYLHYN
jgi:hypothetical protein